MKEHAAHGQIHSGVTGSVIENVAPRSGLFAAHIFAAVAFDDGATDRKAHPSPSGLLVMKGSKIDSSLSAGIPVPLSCTSTSTFDPSIEFVRTIRRRAPSSPGLAHGAEGVEHQVQHDLLELNAVALDRAGRRATGRGRP